ncbi:MAG: dTMP kinase [Candidatus Krumholzibacteriia bacterium]
MPPGSAYFIVLEGIDGAGTTTQAAMLHQYMVDRGRPVSLTREPTDAPLGRFIRETLSGTIGSGEGEPFVPSEGALCLLFAADRIEHSRVIDRARSQGSHVVCDRYILSSIAYQSRDPGISAERVVEVNRGCSVPDMTFFLDVSVDECLRRLETRNDSPTLYEKRDILEAIDRNYRAVRPFYERCFGRLISIDGTRSPSRVHEKITSHIEKQLKP